MEKVRFDEDAKTIARFAEQRQELRVESAKKEAELEDRAEMAEVVVELCMRMTELRKLATQQAYAKVTADGYDLTTLIGAVSRMSLDHPRHREWFDRLQAAKARHAALVETARMPVPADIPKLYEDEFREIRSYLDMPLARSLTDEMIAMLPSINQTLPPSRQLNLTAAPEALIAKTAPALIQKMKDKIVDHKCMLMEHLCNERFINQMDDYDRAKNNFDRDPSYEYYVDALYYTHAAFAKAIRTVGDLTSPSFCPICHSDEPLPFFTCRNKHVFHKRCIVQWIAQSETCPMCRVKVQAKDLV